MSYSQGQAAEGAAPVGGPVIVGGKDGSGLARTLLTNSDGTLVSSSSTGTASEQVQGNVANAAADAGNPVKIGGRADTTVPAAVTDGQRANAWFDEWGRLVTKASGMTTYSASVTALAPAVTATDIFTIIGSATKTVRVTRLQISGVATAAGAYSIQLIKRSTADTTGTLTNPTVVPHDSANAAGTAVVSAYTANPGALGTAVGTIQVKRITVSTAAGAIPIVPTEFGFELRGEQAIVLRGVVQNLAINLNGVTMTGGLLDIDITWTEE